MRFTVTLCERPYLKTVCLCLLRMPLFLHCVPVAASSFDSWLLSDWAFEWLITQWRLSSCKTATFNCRQDDSKQEAHNMINQFAQLGPNNSLFSEIISNMSSYLIDWPSIECYHDGRLKKVDSMTLMAGRVCMFIACSEPVVKGSRCGCQSARRLASLFFIHPAVVVNLTSVSAIIWMLHGLPSTVYYSLHTAARTPASLQAHL